MGDGAKIETLRIGMIGSGFIAKLHLQALVGVRNVVVAGVYSTTAPRREALGRLANEMELGPCEPLDSLAAMAAKGGALWLLDADFTRLAGHTVVVDMT